MRTSATVPVMRPWLGQAEADAAAEAILSGWVAQGPRVAAFERAVADRLACRHAVAVTSATAGLHLALVAAGVGPGDEVVVPSLSFIATTNAVRYVGAEPVFCDVELATQNVTASTVRAVISPSTRAVIVVHQCGVPADLDALQALCAERDLTMIEDAACAIGSRYRGRPIGSGSALAVLSFHPRKILTTGEGGMILTDRDDWAQRLRALRDHGTTMDAFARHESDAPQLESYSEVGFNYRMTDIQGAVGLVQLGRLDDMIERRRALAQRYRRELQGIPGLVMVGDPPYGTTNYQAFWIALPDQFPVSRDDLLRQMAAQGISPRRGVMAAHLEPPYAGTARVPLPVTERLTRRSLILPLFHELTEADQDRVVSVVREAARAAGVLSP